MEQFSLVSTVFNEIKRLNQTLADLIAQTVKPSEMIVTDAGSTDGTYEQLLEFAKAAPFKVVILQQKGCNVAEGRNLAIRMATHDIIASTDFGCRFHPEWLHSLIEPFNDSSVNVVGGSYAVLEEELTSDAEKVAFVLSNGYQFDATADYFIPSSRSIAYRKKVFEAVGGYCEWLTLAADDLIFGMMIQKLGFKIHIANKPYVYWGRHKTYRAYARETFRYGLGDGEAKIKVKAFVKYLYFYCARRVFFIALILGIIVGFPAWLLIAMFVMLPGFMPYYHHLRIWLRLRSAKYNLGVFLKGFYLLEKTHLGYIKGYLKGYYNRSEKKRLGSMELKRKLFGEYRTL